MSLTASMIMLFNTSYVSAETINIARVADAQVFASFNDELPAVLNYFTKKSEQNIIDFYQTQYGDILYRELKRKRLTLKFKQADKNIRVVISQQNKLKQVDVIVTN